MAERLVKTVAPELKMAAQLLLNAEKQLEKYDDQISLLSKTGGPSPTLKPNGAIPASSTASQRAELISQRDKLKATTVSIIEELQKSTHGKTSQDIGQIKSEWLIDNQPAMEGEDQKLRKSMRDMGRLGSDLWKAANMPLRDQTELEKRKDEIVSKQPSAMERARGLQQNLNTPSPTNVDTTASKNMSEPDLEPELD